MAKKPDPARLQVNVMTNFKALVETAYNFRGARDGVEENCAPEVMGSTAMFMAFIAYTLTADPGQPVDHEKAKAMIKTLCEAAEKGLKGIDRMNQMRDRFHG
jgi:hypothetical protein